MQASAPFDSAPTSIPSAVPPPGSPDSRSLLNLPVAAVVIAALFVARDVLIPITLAVMLSFVLSPLVTALRRTGLPRAASVLVAVLMTFGLIALVAVLLASQASTLAADAPRYATAVQQKLEALERRATSEANLVSRWFTRSAGHVPTPVAAPTPAAAPGATSPLAVVRAIVEPVLAPAETTVIVLVIAIFILMQREDLRDRFIRLVGSNDLHRTTAAMDDAGARLSRYFLSQLAVNSTFGLVISVGLWGVGIPSPALWGVLAGVLRFVPYIGPIIAAVPAILLAAAVEPGWYRAAEVTLLFVMVEPVTGYVVEPLLYGHSTGLAPIAVIVAAVFWTWMWGPTGLILSTPLTLCLVVMGRHVKSLEFLDVLLGDQPALAPIDSLYQRILADNPDEVLEKAEALLADRSLLEYYDSVMLPGLRLAAADQLRGIISSSRASAMTHALLQVIDDLRVHRDVAGVVLAAPSAPPPPAAQTPTSAGVIACVSGRGPFDDAASAMLCQLLARAGARSRSIPHADVSRERLSRLDLADVAVIVLSYLDLAGATPHLRYLVKRLRQHAPQATIVVGLWPVDSAGGDVDRQQAVGADDYVATLTNAVSVVLARVGPGHLDPAPD